jgi:phage terminase large subunit-like protein
MPPRKRQLTPEEMLAQLATGIRQQARKPNIYGYVPHDKQRAFHSATAKKRLYIGGNRSGKTTAAVAEAIYYLRGDHPFKSVYEPPVYGRSIGVDFVRGVKSILIPQFQRWIPPSLLKGGSWTRSYDTESRTLTLTNGSTLEFMSYEQDTDKFAGVPRHFTHYDEEPPKHIFNECQARLIDYNGDAWFSMTPVEGMTWVYDELFEKGSRDDPHGQIFIVIADMTDNPHINAEGVANFLLGLDEDEKKRREQGEFVSLGGLVFKGFKPETHVIPYDVPPKSWQWYASVDPGLNNPTCWLWHAVSPNDEVVTFWEEYDSGKVVSEWADIFHERNKSFGKVPDIVVGDPAIKQRNPVTGTSVQLEYAKHEVYIMDGNNDVAIGVNQMTDYLRADPRTSVPFWRITENCSNLIREMQRLRWATWAGRKANYENNKQEKIHKKNDHAPDSARYFFCCLPVLAPVFEEAEQKKRLDDGVLVRYDQVLAQTAAGSTSWTVHEGTDLYAMEYE